MGTWGMGVGLSINGGSVIECDGAKNMPATNTMIAAISGLKARYAQNATVCTKRNCIDANHIRNYKLFVSHIERPQQVLQLEGYCKLSF